MALRKLPSHFESIHIDMTPMVDCIMVLLIFLMISSSFTNDPGIEVSKPDVAGISQDQTNTLLVAITSDDRVYFDGQEVQVEQLAGILRQAGVGRSPSVILRADKATSHGKFAAVYAEAKRAGLARVQFATGYEGAP